MTVKLRMSPLVGAIIGASSNIFCGPELRVIPSLCTLRDNIAGASGDALSKGYGVSAAQLDAATANTVGVRTGAEGKSWRRGEARSDAGAEEATREQPGSVRSRGIGTAHGAVHVHTSILSNNLRGCSAPGSRLSPQ